MRLCEKCLVPIKKGEKFCVNCGTKTINHPNKKQKKQKQKKAKPPKSPKLPKKSPYDLQLLFQAGVRSAQLGNMDMAIMCWEEYSNYRPDEFAVWTNLATAYIQKQDFNKALDCTRKAVDINPNNSEVWDKHGSVLSAKVVKAGLDGRPINRNEMEEAIKSFERSYQINHGNHQALFKIGTAYLGLKEFQKAKEYVDKYLMKVPNDPRVRELLKFIEMQSKQAKGNTCDSCGMELRDNIKFCTECGKPVRSSKTVSTLNVSKLGELQKERINNYPGFPDGKEFQNQEAKRLFTEAKEEIKQYKENQAILTLKKVLEIEPDVPITYQLLSNIYHQERNYSLAKKYAKKALELNQYQVKAWEILENIYHNEGKFDKQDWVIDNLKKFGDVYANYLVDWGFSIANAPNVKDREQQNQMAEHLWKRALLFDPNNQQAKFHLSAFKMFDGITVELDKWNGDYDRAIEYYKKRIENNPNDQMAFRLLRMAEMRKLGLGLL